MIDNTTKFQKELENLLNKYSQENTSNTPDFILANYLITCLNAFNYAINERYAFYGGDGDIDNTDTILAKEAKTQYVVRLYDGFDRIWLDVSQPCSYEEAERIWHEYTKFGTEKTTYEDIDYYNIFPSDVTMLFKNK